MLVVDPVEVAVTTSPSESSDHVVVKRIETVYIAGPYSGGDVEDNVRAAMHAAHAVMDLGVVPFVPHLCHFLHGLRERGYEEWMNFDFVWLDRTDALLRIPGVSPGAEREVLRMLKLGRPIFHSIEALAKYLKVSN